MGLPRLYPIVDAGMLEARGIALDTVARMLRDAGVTLLQYRDKLASPQTVLRNAAVIREAYTGVDCRLILNETIGLDEFFRCLCSSIR